MCTRTGKKAARPVRPPGTTECHSAAASAGILCCARVCACARFELFFFLRLPIPRAPFAFYTSLGCVYNNNNNTRNGCDIPLPFYSSSSSSSLFGPLPLLYSPPPPPVTVCLCSTTRTTDRPTNQPLCASDTHTNARPTRNACSFPAPLVDEIYSLKQQRQSKKKKKHNNIV